jgi:hypothetical protein
MEASLETRPNKYVPSARAADPKSHGRSKVTNHRDLLPYIADGRARQARRFRDCVRALICDAGGIENLSEVKLGLVRRLAAATVLSEDLEVRAVNGEPIDIGTFCQLASTTVRLASRLGIERVARSINDPTLAIYEQELARFEAEDGA